MASTAAASAQDARTRLKFLDLPNEVQREIFKQCSQSSLICLSLVSHYFRELAAAQLYRNYHIVFPDDDDPAFDSPIDGLAGGLETFVTSEYDYARHLRDLSLDTLSGGDKAAIAYKPYLYSVSCGKFLNTLLLLTLRKATQLESFKWSIRVELSRQVYRALHNLENLTRLHIRLQSGPSLFEVPPPLPIVAPPASHAPPPAPIHIAGPILPPPPPPQLGGLTIMGPPPTNFYIPALPAIPPPAPKAHPRTRLWKRPPCPQDPPTLSGFKNLRSLAVLDIDVLDILELRACVRNSTRTLKKLKLSFSDVLARQARRPMADLDTTDESDVEDEFGVTLAFNDSGNEDTGPAVAYRAQEERKIQESVLGRVLDVEPLQVSKTMKQPKEEGAPKPTEEVAKSPGEEFIGALNKVSGKLLKDLSGASDYTAAQQEILDVIEAAARKYVAAQSTTSEVLVEPSSSAVAEQGGLSAPDNPPVEASITADNNSTVVSHTVTSARVDSDESRPEDIDIEHPTETLELQADEEQEPSRPEPTTATVNSHTLPDIPIRTAPGLTPEAIAQLKNSRDPHVRKIVNELTAQKAAHQSLVDELHKLNNFNRTACAALQAEAAAAADHVSRLMVMRKFEEHAQKFMGIISGVTSKMNTVMAELEKTEKECKRFYGDEDSSQDYIRSTRGMALQSLSIYLIPVKASVLSKALDLRALTRLTLLNVGVQAPIWNMLAKENAISPLALHKIFTDNVSMPFLTCVSELRVVTELFMMERTDKVRPESFAPKTVTTISHIRRLVLRKHLGTLKKLMIKHSNDTTWNIDAKTMLLLARRGRGLEELAVSMSVRTLHTFLRHIRTFANLRALHIISLRTDDTCASVMRETKRFLIDCVSHYPELKLEWVSIDEDDRVEHIIRVVDVPSNSDDDEDGDDGINNGTTSSLNGAKKSKKKKKKSKAKSSSPTAAGPASGSGIASGVPSVAATASATAGASSSSGTQYPIMSLSSMNELWVESSEDDDDDDDDGYGGDDGGAAKKEPKITLETIENIRFFDAWGVRIFKKEIVLGRL